MKKIFLFLLFFSPASSILAGENTTQNSNSLFFTVGDGDVEIDSKTASLSETINKMYCEANGSDLQTIPLGGPVKSKKIFNSVFELAQIINRAAADPAHSIRRNTELTDGSIDNGIMMSRLQPLVDNHLKEFTPNEVADFVTHLDYLNIQPAETLNAAIRVLIEKTKFTIRSPLISQELGANLVRKGSIKKFNSSNPQ